MVHLIRHAALQDAILELALCQCSGSSPKMYIVLTDLVVRKARIAVCNIGLDQCCLLVTAGMLNCNVLLTTHRQLKFVMESCVKCHQSLACVS